MVLKSELNIKQVSFIFARIAPATLKIEHDPSTDRIATRSYGL
jgi:hypothetical protein